jgi:hypothetical protein
MMIEGCRRSQEAMTRVVKLMILKHLEVGINTQLASVVFQIIKTLQTNNLWRHFAAITQETGPASERGCMEVTGLSSITDHAIAEGRQRRNGISNVWGNIWGSGDNLKGVEEV